MLARIHTDHAHIGTLLAVLDTKRQRMEAGQTVNLALIRDILDYLQRYAEHSHHPLEDIIYQYYQDEKNGSDALVEQLLDEHKQLSATTLEFSATLDLILNDVVVPKQKLIDELKELVTIQRKHMVMEETEVLPLIQREFSSEDWQQIHKLVGDKLIQDPLFDDSDDQEYEDLRVYLTEADQP